MLLICRRCKEQFETRNVMWRGKPILRLCSICRSKRHTDSYYSTSLGKAKRAWNNMRHRVTHADAYRHVEIRMTQEEFERWYLKELSKWEKEHYNEKPSIDRIRSKGHYELSNIRIVSLSENRKRNSRNKYKDAPEGKLWCPGCERFRNKEKFYERPSIAITETNIRNHWSAKCKSCAKKEAKARWQEKHGVPSEPTGVCERCNKRLKPTTAGKVSKARFCHSCKHILWEEKHPEYLERTAERRKECSRIRQQRYRERKKQ